MYRLIRPYRDNIPKTTKARLNKFFCDPVVMRDASRGHEARVGYDDDKQLPAVVIASSKHVFFNLPLGMVFLSWVTRTSLVDIDICLTALFFLSAPSLFRLVCPRHAAHSGREKMNKKK